MKFVDLSQHLRELRNNSSGRKPSAAMRGMEVWKAAIKCPDNGISAVFYNETKLPAPAYGFFSRLGDGNGNFIADIYVHKPHHKSEKRRLAPHWKEFVLIKELMHCWSPLSTYVGSPQAAAELLDTLNIPSGPFGRIAIADFIAVLAAAEVVLPYDIVKAAMGAGKETAQIAHEHGLHPEIVAYICRHDIMEERLIGCL